jgi:2'-5' RNA ligase
MRAFVALDLPGEVTAALVRLQTGLQAGRMVPEENLHLTLVFLDEIADMAAADLHERLAAIRTAPVALEISGLDLFGGRRPSVLFAAVRHSEALDLLHDKVTMAARAAGITLERRRFRPHVTLARFNPGMDRRAQARLSEFLAVHGTFALPPVTLDRFTLYRSHLRHDGAVHEALAQYPLGR